MRLFGAYLRQHKKLIAAALLFVAVFGVSFFLFHLPLEAVAYPTLLCAILGTVFAAADFAKVRRRHRRLEEIARLTAAMITDMPAAETVAEEDYQAVIEALRAEIAGLETLSTARYRDMVEYYTVWAHQIKTPITSMRLTLQNEDTPLSRKLSLELSQIERYVEMVLAFLRLDSTSSDYVFAQHDLDAIIRPAVAKFASDFIDRKLRLDYTPVHGTVVTDEKWLSFVVEQVLSNALKYTREGGIGIYMREPKTLCIEDTGIGIAPEDLPRIFEKGYTGTNGRWDKKASGLGLYLCRRICKNLGAEISVASRPGEGTTVQIDLPEDGGRKE